MDELDTSATGLSFRPSKRRKVFRRRQEEEEDGDHVTAAISDAPGAIVSPTAVVERGIESETVGDVSKQRRPAAIRKRGVGFSSSRVQQGGDHVVTEESSALVPLDSVVEVAHSRFMAPTGQAIVKEDKHMVAYVDAKLADLRSQPHTTPSEPLPTPSTISDVQRPVPKKSEVTSTPYDEVEEIDLPPSTSSTLSGAKAPKPSRRARPARLGRDGKPLPPRRPRYAVRTNSDLARDALVEQILSESSLPQTHYTSLPSTSHNSSTSKGAGASAPGHDTAADARIAEEFQREFMAQVEERNAAMNRKVEASAASNGGGAGNDGMKGPKLGGSRSQRAAMKLAEEKKK